MGLAIYPGSFDPVTRGHLDVIERASHIFQHLIVAVAPNEQKAALFSTEERLAFLTAATVHLQNVEIAELDGLTVDYARRRGALALIRGLRAVSDFEFEFQMALMNRRLAPELETIFLTPKEDYTFLSSRLVKEIARLGGDVSPFVIEPVCQALRRKFQLASSTS